MYKRQLVAQLHIVGADLIPVGPENGVVRRPVAYLAGPDMFWPNGDEIGAHYVELSHKYGIDGIFPPDPAREDEFLSLIHI